MMEAVLFDLDDTIISFDGVSHQAWMDVCSKNNFIDSQLLLNTIYQVSNEYWSDPVRHRIGRLKLDQTRIMLVEEAFKQLGHPNPDEAERLAMGYTKIRESLIHLFPGAIETLKHFQAHNCKMALITNGESTKQRAKINRFGLVGFFDQILIEEEFGVGKPDIKVYQHVLDEFGIKPSEACMIGDNLDWDVFAPQQLGITGVWNNYQKKDQKTLNQSRMPDYSVNGIEEFYPLFRSKLAHQPEKRERVDYGI